MRTRNIDDRRWDFAVNVVAANILAGEQRRGRLLRRAGLRVDPTARVQHDCWFFGADVQIGAAAWVNHRCYFDARGAIVIGDCCDLGMEVMLCTSTHAPGDRRRRAGASRSAPIRIGDGTWVGSRALILPGVTIGAGCVVAAGAVVTGDCEPDGLYAGVPARRIQDLEAADVSATPARPAPRG